MLTSHKNNAKGIVTDAAVRWQYFAVGDTFVKTSGSFLSPAQIMFFLISGGLIIFASDCASGKGRKPKRTSGPRTSFTGAVLCGDDRSAGHGHVP